MDLNDIRNSRLPNRIDKSLYHDFSKSARHRSSFNIPNFMDNRRTKTSLSEKDLNCREDSFNFLYQKQIPIKTSHHKSDKQLNPSVIVRRKPEDKLKNPDRITLDRQNLTSCPILDNEENVRLLNYQYNYIHQIQHLDKLRKLILLDLYDNRIEKISGLDTLKSLRVLMLGRNRISKIEGLDSLTRLDVLDLHANCLQVIENIDHLSDLRVLNLAGNNITCLTNLKGLYSLSEINVRRNFIDSVVDVNSNNCPNLQRVFLSFNQLNKISDFSCLVDLLSLNELSMDNNPICNLSNFRSAMIFNFAQLELLDSKAISEDDRIRAKQILNRMELGSKSNSGLSRHLQLNPSRHISNEQLPNNIQRFHSLKERRKGNLPNSQRVSEGWNQNGKNVSPRLSIKCFSGTSNPLYVTDSVNILSTSHDIDKDLPSKSFGQNKLNDSTKNVPKEFMAIEDTIAKFNEHHHSPQLESPQISSNKTITTRPSSSSSCPSKTELSKTTNSSNVNSSDVNEILSMSSNTTSSEDKKQSKNIVEIINDNEQMQFYSPSSLKTFSDKDFWITKAGLSTSITTIIFQKIDFTDIEKIFFQIKARFPSLKKIVFQSCNIKCYTQINSIANLKRLEELTIDKVENPIASFSLLRHYVIFRLAHLGLKKFNDIEITEHEYLVARRYFFTLAIIGPNHILQLHLIGDITDIRRRELLHSSNSNNQLTPLTIHNPSFSQTSSINLDLVGKSGILCNSTISDLEEISESNDISLSRAVMDRIMDDVEKQCDWENRFSNQWLSSIWQIIVNRLPQILSNRHDYMKQQFDKIACSKSISSKSNLTSQNRK